MTIRRRSFLQMLAGGAAFAVAPAGAAEPTLMGRLIEKAQVFPHIGERIEFISSALLGTRYRSNTLIGGPARRELFVVRADAFDCVTYCETVLAAAASRDLEDFKERLRAIRYRHGVIAWRERNHYFYEWTGNNVEARLCEPVVLPEAVKIEKTIDHMWALGARKMSISATPATALFSHADKLAAGDIVGFLSGRTGLDYFHVGFITFGKDGALMLRHAAQSKRRVLDEPLARFVAQNRVKNVTLLRAADAALQTADGKKNG